MLPIYRGNLDDFMLCVVPPLADFTLDTLALIPSGFHSFRPLVAFF